MQIIQRLTHAPKIGMLPVQQTHFVVGFDDSKSTRRNSPASEMNAGFYVQAQRETERSAGLQQKCRGLRFVNPLLLGHHFDECGPSLIISPRRPAMSASQNSNPTHVSRRKFIAGIAVAPLVAAPAVAAPETEVQRLYRDWLALTERYDVCDLAWLNGEATDVQFEALTDPILKRRDQIERKICTTDCASISDLLIKIKIAAHYDWCIDDYQEAIAADAASRLWEARKAVAA